MFDSESLIKTIYLLLNQEAPLLVELQKSLLEIEEFISSEEYSLLDVDERSQIQTIRKDIRSRINEIEENKSDPLQNNTILSKNSTAKVEDDSSAEPDKSSPPLQSRDPIAENEMEEAEKYFYSGRYSEAIKLFDRVLNLEPNWERAKQHRSEAENYLRTGYIPPIALPSEAASAFGKAQSAARVGRYSDAMAFLAHSQEVLRDAGIQRWQEGLEFEQKLQENIDAEFAYQEGLTLLSEGNLDDAIERIDTAARATGLPKYNDKAQQLRAMKETIRSINENLSSLKFDAQKALKTKSDLDLLTAEYGINPAIQKLIVRLTDAIPSILGPMKEQVRSQKSQADRAATIDEAIYAGNQAKNTLEQMRVLGAADESLDRLQSEVDRLVKDIQNLENDLMSAKTSLDNNPRWPSQAAKISKPVRQRFPNDPEVIRLRKGLSGYFLKRSALMLVLSLLLVLVLAGLGWWLSGQYKVYMISLTPTTTPTPSATPPPSNTPTPSPSPTITPTLTLTPTPTSTPIVGIAMRDIWARSGCYEGFTATGKIPSGGDLLFLPTERRFDQFNRECVLVEYQSEGKSVIGWVLILDVGNSLLTVTP